MLDLEVKKAIATEYIQKKDLLKWVKGIDESFAALTWEVEEWRATKNTREALEDFLVSENMFEWMWDLFTKNLSTIAFLSEDKKEELDKAKEIINNSSTNEQSIRSKLWLEKKYTPNTVNTNTTNTPKQTSENINTNIEDSIVKEDYIYDKAIEYWVTDPNQIAYILSTVKRESSFKNQEEKWWEKRRYGLEDEQTGQGYYWRWFIQITHKGTYEKFNKIIKSSWKTFRDNNGNVLLNIDIVNHPNQIRKSNDLSAFILIYGMKNWTFTSKKLDDYINKNKVDFIWARAIVNWNDKAEIFANDAKNYLNKINTNQLAA